VRCKQMEPLAQQKDSRHPVFKDKYLIFQVFGWGTRPAIREKWRGEGGKGTAEGRGEGEGMETVMAGHL